jgi:hypothetical protein
MVDCEIGVEDLQGNGTVVLEIAGEMNGGHATAPKLTLERVAVAQGLGERGRGVSDDGGSIGSRDAPNLRLPGELRQRGAAGRAGGTGRPCGDIDRRLQRIDLWRHGSLQARFGDSGTHPHSASTYSSNQSPRNRHRPRRRRCHRGTAVRAPEVATRRSRSYRSSVKCLVRSCSESRCHCACTAGGGGCRTSPDRPISPWPIFGPQPIP